MSKAKSQIQETQPANSTVESAKTASSRMKWTLGVVCACSIISCGVGLNSAIRNDAKLSTMSENLTYVVEHMQDTIDYIDKQKDFTEYDYFQNHNLGHLTVEKMRTITETIQDDQFVIMMEMPTCSHCVKDLEVLKSYYNQYGDPDIPIYFADVTQSDLWMVQDETPESTGKEFYVTGTPTYWIYDNGTWTQRVGSGTMQQILG